MTGPRIIKKSPNRRLYDTESSHYITLTDVRDLVLQGQQIKVVDAKTDEDLTRSILLQIMLEEEAAGEPLFTANMLAQIIRFYGGTMQGLFARYLEESLAMFAQQQPSWQDSLGAKPLQEMTELARKNMELWQDMQESFLRSIGMGAGRNKDS